MVVGALQKSRGGQSCVLRCEGMPARMYCRFLELPQERGCRTTETTTHRNICPTPAKSRNQKKKKKNYFGPPLGIDPLSRHMSTPSVHPMAVLEATHDSLLCDLRIVAQPSVVLPNLGRPITGFEKSLTSHSGYLGLP